VVSCGIAAFGTVQATLDDMAALRQRPGPVVGPPLPPSFLKYSDEQTVVGLAAVYQAIQDFGLAGRAFHDWGILAAPRYLGRLGLAEGLHKFHQGGPWKASPMLIPNRSLHSVASTICLALQSRGPNFGAGGGPSSLSEGLLAALTVLDEGRLPGLWVVLTRWDPEPIPDVDNSSLVPTHCLAVALACTPHGDNTPNLRWRLTLSNNGPREENHPLAPSLAGLISFLTGDSSPSVSGKWECPLAWGAHLELTRTAEPEARGRQPIRDMEP
jgi:hypothetical protein